MRREKGSFGGCEGGAACRDEVVDLVAATAERFDPDVSEVLYGTAAGLVPSIRPAAAVVHELCGDAERILRERGPALLA